MRFFFGLILLSCIFVESFLTIDDNEFILCTSRCSPTILSFSQSVIFPPECQENDNFSTVYDYALACGIEYLIDYDAQQIRIIFQATNITNNLAGQKLAEYLFQTIRLGFTQEINQMNVTTRKYICNTKNDCARAFYLNTIEYLIGDGQSQLDSIKTKLYNPSLITGATSRRRCTDSSKKGNKTSVRCPDGLCYANYASYNLNEQQNPLTQRCDHEMRPVLFCEIERRLPELSTNEKEIIEYRSNKNVFNRKDKFDIIRNNLHQYTNWNPTPKQTNEIPSNLDTADINQKKLNSSLQQTLSSYVLVLFFLCLQLFY